MRGVIANQFSVIIKKILIDKGYDTLSYDWDGFVTRFIDFLVASRIYNRVEMMATGKIEPEQTGIMAMTFIGSKKTANVDKACMWTLYGVCETSPEETVSKSSLLGSRISSPYVYLYPSPNNTVGIQMLLVSGGFDRIVFAPMAISTLLKIVDFIGEELDFSNIKSAYPNTFLYIEISLAHGLKRVRLPKDKNVALQIVRSYTKPKIIDAQGEEKAVKYTEMEYGTEIAYNLILKMAV